MQLFLCSTTASAYSCFYQVLHILKYLLHPTPTHNKPLCTLVSLSVFEELNVLSSEFCFTFITIKL